MAVLGEEAKGVSVNAQVNNQTSSMSAIRPGYVLDLSALHRKREPRTPDAEPPATDGEPE